MRTFKSGDLCQFNPCTSAGVTRSRSHVKAVSVGQPKHETILEEKGDIHIMGNKKYKVWSKILSSKWVPCNLYWRVWPKLSLLMYKVYANCGLSCFNCHFYCVHGLHIPENLCSTIVAKVGTRAHHDTFRRLMRAQIIGGWIWMRCQLGRSFNGLGAFGTGWYRIGRNLQIDGTCEGGGHYVGPASNRPPPSFRVIVDCHEGYMLILRLGDETYVKLVWVARSLS